MSEHSDSVKQTARKFASQATRLQESDPERSADLQATADKLLAAAAELDRLTDLTTAMPRSLGSVSDLPEELVAELSSVKVDELEDQIVTVINAYDGVANIDQILVGLFRKFKVVQTRRFMLNKLYRMMRNDLLFSVPGRKGIYSTSELENADPPEPEDDDDPFKPDSTFDEEIPF